jgi:hypothetical protein
VTAGVPQSASNIIRFLLDGEQVNASGLPPTMTVLEYLREVAHRTGTKEGCAEGDCGACTVVLGELAPDGARVGYRAVNSCIRLLPTIDGQELVTVESLQARDGASASSAAGHGGQSWLAMRFLHAGIRDVAVRAVSAPPVPGARTGARDAVGKSVSLYRLPPHH